MYELDVLLYSSHNGRGLFVTHRTNYSNFNAVYTNDIAFIVDSHSHILTAIGYQASIPYSAIAIQECVRFY